MEDTCSDLLEGAELFFELDEADNKDGDGCWCKEYVHDASWAHGLSCVWGGEKGSEFGPTVGSRTVP